VQIRCPHCREVLYIERSEFDMETLCPRCKQTFIWGNILKAEETKRRYEEERRRRLEEQRRRQEEERRRRRLEAQKRQEQKFRELLEKKYRCGGCGKPLCEQDIINGDAIKEDDKVYCREHLPKLRKCPACGRDVSRRAPSCPHCGEPMVVLPEILPMKEGSFPVKVERFYPAQTGRGDKGGYPSALPQMPVRHETPAATGFKLGFFGCLGVIAAVWAVCAVIAFLVIGVGSAGSTASTLTSESPPAEVRAIEKVGRERKREIERKRREKELRREIEKRKREEELRWANPISVSAEELYREYKNNEVRADSAYKGEILRVSGVVTDIGRDILGQPYVCLAGGKEMWYEGDYIGWSIQCFFSDAHDLSRLSKRDYVTIIGECRGKILLNVILEKCKLRR